jgi:chromosome segregation ATPase
MTAALRLAETELKTLLDDHPELKSFQRKIDLALLKAGDETSNRLDTVSFYLRENLSELRTELQLLHLKLMDVQEDMIELQTRLAGHDKTSHG